jgi:flagellar protein FlbD
MIRLFRQDGLEFMLNVDLIKDIATDPDTVITLINGEKIKVKNTLTDVLTKITAYRIGREEENRSMESNPLDEQNKNGRS